ncbi:hypothetical protein HanXRQr2_Chr16g0741821 [Helianthus annuus]|uniref:Uncharacterized protein n=1 Tax=Helianthus annuus TaxID=4232 RepID=A0A9K3DRR2_HELAN|nr:hypothetical protein HanXRQr2_Chr16g0741821 [Helianthus annuus]
MCHMLLKLGFYRVLDSRIRYRNVGLRRNTSINIRKMKHDGRTDLKHPRRYFLIIIDVLE